MGDVDLSRKSLCFVYAAVKLEFFGVVFWNLQPPKSILSEVLV